MLWNSWPWDLVAITASAPAATSNHSAERALNYILNTLMNEDVDQKVVAAAARDEGHVLPAAGAGAAALPAPPAAPAPVVNLADDADEDEGENDDEDEDQPRRSLRILRRSRSRTRGLRRSGPQQLRSTGSH